MELIEACRNGDYEKVKEILQSEVVDVNYKDDKTSPLIVASMKGHDKIVELLLHFGNTKVGDAINSGVDVNIKDADGETALINACEFGREKVVELLLKHKDVDVNIVNNYGNSALIKSMFSGHFNIVNLLLQRSEIDVNIKNMYTDNALIISADRGYDKIVELLLHLGRDVDINAVNKNNLTALNIASYKGHDKVVKLLLSYSINDDANTVVVDVNTKDSYGNTALINASINNHEKIVEMLLNHKNKKGELDVDLYITNNNGNNAMKEIILHNNLNLIQKFSKFLNTSNNAKHSDHSSFKPNVANELSAPEMTNNKIIKASGKKKKELIEKNQKGDVILHEYTTDDVYDRTDGPAYIKYDNKGNIVKQMFYKSGKLHNSNGPAVIDFTGKVKKEEYWLNGVKFLKDEYTAQKPIQSNYFTDVSDKKDMQQKCGDKVDYISTEPYTSFDNIFIFKQRNGSYRCFSSDELKYIISNYDNKSKHINGLRGTPDYEFGGDAFIADVNKILRDIDSKKELNKKYNRKLNPYSLFE
jgi:ankyrin repeat protein